MPVIGAAGSLAYGPVSPRILCPLPIIGGHGHGHGRRIAPINHGRWSK